MKFYILCPKTLEFPPSGSVDFRIFDNAAIKIMLTEPKLSELRENEYLYEAIFTHPGELLQAVWCAASCNLFFTFHIQVLKRYNVTVAQYSEPEPLEKKA